MAFSRTWNTTYEASPADTDQAKQGALRIREVKEDVRERVEIDHFWEDATHGGKHKQVRFRELVSDPAFVADEGVLYLKDVAGITELFYIDSDGNVLQLSSGGALSVAVRDGGPSLMDNFSFDAAVAASILTVSLKQRDGTDPTGSKPASIAFRSATANSGAYSVVQVTSALSLAILAGATLGFTSSEDNYIYVFAINNAGVVELAVMGKPLNEEPSEGVVVSTTLLDGTSDDSDVLYSATARINVPVRYIGRIRIQSGSTAGNWDNVPSEIWPAQPRNPSFPAESSITQARMADAAVGQAKLKTTTGDSSFSATSGTAQRTLAGGQYGFFPQVSMTIRALSGTGQVRWFFTSDTVLGTHVRMEVEATSGSGKQTITMRQRFVQASPPYEPFRAGDSVPLFVYALIEKDTNFIRGTYIAEDPPWANNGPTVINPIGRYQRLVKQHFIPDSLTPEEQMERWADLENWLRNGENIKQVLKELNTPISQEEKNRDMPLISHPFGDYNPAKHAIVLLSPTDCRFTRALRNRMLVGGDSISEMLHEGAFEIGNTPIAGLDTPLNVMAVDCRMKSSGRR